MCSCWGIVDLAYLDLGGLNTNSSLAFEGLELEATIHFHRGGKRDHFHLFSVSTPTLPKTVSAVNQALIVSYLKVK